MTKQSDLTLNEIRQAQESIASRMLEPDLPAGEAVLLEKASLKLRNLERMLVAGQTNRFIGELRSETAGLKKLAGQITRNAAKLSALTERLRRVVSLLEKVADILDLIK